MILECRVINCYTSQTEGVFKIGDECTSDYGFYCEFPNRRRGYVVIGVRRGTIPMMDASGNDYGRSRYGASYSVDLRNADLGHISSEFSSVCIEFTTVTDDPYDRDVGEIMERVNSERLNITARNGEGEKVFNLCGSELEFGDRQIDNPTSFIVELVELVANELDDLYQTLGSSDDPRSEVDIQHLSELLHDINVMKRLLRTVPYYVSELLN